MNLYSKKSKRIISTIIVVILVLSMVIPTVLSVIN